MSETIYWILKVCCESVFSEETPQGAEPINKLSLGPGFICNKNFAIFQK